MAVRHFYSSQSLGRHSGRIIAFLITLARNIAMVPVSITCHS